MNTTFPLTTKEGHKYLIKLSSFNADYIPDSIDIEIVDIVLELVEHSDQINNISTLSKIGRILLNFLEENDVILYFYCSKDDIYKNKPDISAQEYRSILFSKIFERTTKTLRDYENLKVTIKGHNDHHYIHLIAKSKYKHHLENISDQLKSMNK